MIFYLLIKRWPIHGEIIQQYILDYIFGLPNKTWLTDFNVMSTRLGLFYSEIRDLHTSSVYIHIFM